MEDEVDLNVYIKVIVKQKYTIVGVILIGIVIAVFSLITTPKVYKATGYYKEIKVIQKGWFRKPASKYNLTQLIAEAKIKYPSVDISIPKDTKIISIKTTGATQQEVKFECMRIAESLPIVKIVDVRSKLVKSRNKGALIVVGFTFLAFCMAFVKEWWSKNKGEICGK